MVRHLALPTRELVSTVDDAIAVDDAGGAETKNAQEVGQQGPANRSAEVGSPGRKKSPKLFLVDVNSRIRLEAC
jgi:hypothetical protein